MVAGACGGKVVALTPGLPAKADSAGPSTALQGPGPHQYLRIPGMPVSLRLLVLQGCPLTRYPVLTMQEAEAPCPVFTTRAQLPPTQCSGATSENRSTGCTGTDAGAPDPAQRGAVAGAA